jgi:hypothetical protein
MLVADRRLINQYSWQCQISELAMNQPNLKNGFLPRESKTTGNQVLEELTEQTSGQELKDLNIQ